ncbi:MAG: tetratricopeptide repeat protein [candidate division WOR-3 bacterium]|nr:MAG: tetratricopeptide repeat protein [candidate division WOR-3 bacterium]
MNKSTWLFFLFILICLSCARKEERISNARKFIAEWNYDRALTEIISLRKNKDSEIQYIIGYCYLRKNEYAEALDYFAASLAIDTTFKDSIIRIYNALSQNALKINEPERALFLHQEIAKLVPEYEQTSNLFLIGDLNFENSNHEAAIRAYRRALQIDSTSKDARNAKPNLIRALAATGDYSPALSMALAEYEKLKTAANLLLVSEIQLSLGTKHFTAGILDSAEIYFGHIIANGEPKSMLDDAYFYTAEIYYARSNFDVALELYKKVVRLDPYQKGEMTQKAKERIKEIKEKK